MPCLSATLARQPYLEVHIHQTMPVVACSKILLKSRGNFRHIAGIFRTLSTIRNCFTSCGSPCSKLWIRHQFSETVGEQMLQKFDWTLQSYIHSQEPSWTLSWSAEKAATAPGELSEVLICAFLIRSRPHAKSVLIVAWSLLQPTWKDVATSAREMHTHHLFPSARSWLIFHGCCLHAIVLRLRQNRETWNRHPCARVKACCNHECFKPPSKPTLSQQFLHCTSICVHICLPIVSITAAHASSMTFLTARTRKHVLTVTQEFFSCVRECNNRYTYKSS